MECVGLKHKSFLFLLIVMSMGVNAEMYGVDVQGHRGARWSRPENTWSGFLFAIQNGATTLEMDAVVTKDDVVVLSHDLVINSSLCVDKKSKATIESKPIRKMTWAELSSLDCGHKRNPKFPHQVRQEGEGIPQLVDVLQKASKLRPTIRFNIETKLDSEHTDWSPDPERFVELIAEVVGKTGTVDQVTLQSFDFRTLKVAQNKGLKFKRAALVERRPKGDLLAQLRAAGADIYSPEHSSLAWADVRVLRKAGIQVIPWTVNRETDWDRLLRFGVDGIITDNPKGLVEYLRTKSKPDTNEN